MKPKLAALQCFARAGKMEPNRLFNGFGPLQPAVAMHWLLQDSQRFHLWISHMSTNFNFFILFRLCFKSNNLLLLIPLVRAIVVNDVYKKLYEKCVDDLKISNKIILLIYGLLALNFWSFRKEMKCRLCCIIF